MTDPRPRPPAARRARRLALLLSLILVPAVLTGAPPAARGDAPPSGAASADAARWRAVLGALAPTPDAYLEPGALKATVTLETSASIPGLPVRQHPVNAGLFATGCGQCHRLAAPQPAASGAPEDVFALLPSVAVTAAPPPGFRRVTTGPAREEFPSWAPDGGSILFEAQGDDGSWSLHLADAAGNVRALTAGPAAGWAEWSPDGRAIAYWAPDDAGRGNLWLMDGAGGERRQLTHAAAAAFPVWSPDGRRIAYQVQGRDGRWSIALLDPATRATRNVSPPDQVMPSRPQFAPDGRSIAYQVASTGRFGLWRLEFPALEGGAVDYDATPRSIPGSTLLPMDIGQARGNSVWSPDGTRLALQMIDLATIPTGQLVLTYKTWLTDPDGSHPQLLVPGGTLADRSPSWSPTGNWLVQWSWNDDLRAAVWLARPDGSRALDLTEAFGADALYPAWSPDGTRVAFSSDRAGSFDIWVADLAVLVPGFAP